MAQSPTTPTREETFARTCEQPGVDLSRLAPGTCVRVETVREVYEIIVTDPLTCSIEVCGTDKHLKRPVAGCFARSILEDDPNCVLESWIKAELRMEFRYGANTFTSGPVVSARVEGKGWYYEVF
jgi:hypothetical protein